MGMQIKSVFTWNSPILKSVLRPVTQTLLLFNDGGFYI